MFVFTEYQSSSEGGTWSLPAIRHQQQNPKLPPLGSKMDGGSEKGHIPIGLSEQL